MEEFSVCQHLRARVYNIKNIFTTKFYLLQDKKKSSKSSPIQKPGSPFRRPEMMIYDG